MASKYFREAVRDISLTTKNRVSIQHFMLEYLDIDIEKDIEVSISKLEDSLIHNVEEWIKAGMPNKANDQRVQSLIKVIEEIKK